MYEEVSPGTPQNDDDAEYFFSKQFVQKCKHLLKSLHHLLVTTLKTFEEAAKFIHDWIKVEKHNAVVSEKIER